MVHLPKKALLKTWIQTLFHILVRGASESILFSVGVHLLQHSTKRITTIQHNNNKIRITIMSSKEEETTKEEPDTHEDEQMVVTENESNVSDDEDAMIAPEPFLTPNVAPSTHDDMHQEESTTIDDVKENEEEVSKPKLALSSSSSSSPDLESLEADSWSSEHMETLANHATIASTHERNSNVKTKKKEVQFSSLAPELVLVSSSSNDDGDSAASERSWTCADSVATDSIHSIKQSPTMLTIDTTDTSTTNHTHEIKDSPTTMDQVQEQQAEEQVEKQPRAKLDNFQPVALQPQNSANTLTACLKDSYLPISATDTVLGGDTEPQVSSSNTVPFAFDEEEEEGGGYSRVSLKTIGYART